MNLTDLKSGDLIVFLKNNEPYLVWGRNGKEVVDIEGKEICLFLSFEFSSENRYNEKITTFKVLYKNKIVLIPFSEKDFISGFMLKKCDDDLFIGGERKIRKAFGKTTNSLAFLSFDKLTNELEITFSNGSVYLYSGIPEDLVLELINAEKPGQVFSSMIKKGTWNYIRIK